jgi:hypothetical protein
MWNWVKTRSKDTVYYFDFSCDKIIDLNGLEAALYTIRYITLNYPPPYTLYLSGGVDSQAMLYAWLISNVPFKTLSAIYCNNFNEHDLVTLENFSKTVNYKVNYIDFDLINFLENEHDYYANKYICGSPQITTFMKLADLTKTGTVLLSGNFIQSKKVGLPDHNNMGLYHYSKNKNVIPFFFLETQELAHAFIQDKTVEPGISTYIQKVLCYQQNNFPVISQEKKFNGFEKIKEYYDINPPRIPTITDKIALLPGKINNRNFDLLYRNKYEARFIHYKYNYIC